LDEEQRESGGSRPFRGVYQVCEHGAQAQQHVFHQLLNNAYMMYTVQVTKREITAYIAST